MITLILPVLLTIASADENKNCITAAATSTTCCQSPLTHEDQCLTAETKTLAAKVRAYQDAIAKPAGGIRDTTREARTRALALKDSAALNTQLSANCEQLANACVATCLPLKTMDAANAAKTCGENAKVALAMKVQAERDAANAKRR